MWFSINYWLHNQLEKLDSFEEGKSCKLFDPTRALHPPLKQLGEQTSRLCVMWVPSLHYKTSLFTCCFTSLHFHRPNWIKHQRKNPHTQQCKHGLASALCSVPSGCWEAPSRPLAAPSTQRTAQKPWVCALRAGDARLCRYVDMANDICGCIEMFCNLVIRARSWLACSYQELALVLFLARLGRQNLIFAFFLNVLLCLFCDAAVFPWLLDSPHDMCSLLPCVFIFCFTFGLLSTLILMLKIILVPFLGRRANWATFHLILTEIPCNVIICMATSSPSAPNGSATEWGSCAW